MGRREWGGYINSWKGEREERQEGMKYGKWTERRNRCDEGKKGFESLRTMNKGWERWQRMETNRLTGGKGTEGRKVEKGENRRDKWNWG